MGMSAEGLRNSAANVAGMERQRNPGRATRSAPGLRFAPSGLRLLD
jgi:hypothetical protein